MKEYLFYENLKTLDPDLSKLCKLEAERQARRLIMIPSESSTPMAVRELLSSAFQNNYAEGYPRTETRYQNEETLFDYPLQLNVYRRCSDQRYYKGVDYVNTVESVARRRCAELFAANGLTADDLWVNVQPLSGAPANTAVYTALINPGDPILGMDLLHGGHLTHGSPVNRSGLVYTAHHYTVDPVTEKLDYDKIMEQAKACQPKIIIAGYTSYPWVPDWKEFRKIADSVGAYLLADISHIAGLIAAGVVPSPVGIADVVSSTTHKTLCGPRGAVLICHDRSIGERIDKGVFPGEQGGPHINNIAAMALAFKLAATNQFKELQKQIVKNAQAMAQRFEENGVKVPYKGTNTHMLLIDCKDFKGPEGVSLNGDLAARLLENVGIVANRNTIPGDRSALRSSGVRLGAPWLTQRGYKEEDFIQIADLITKLFKASYPYQMCGSAGRKTNVKVDFKEYAEVQVQVAKLAAKMPSADYIENPSGYPHFFNIEDEFPGEFAAFEIYGEKVRSFLTFILTSDMESLQAGQSQATCMRTSLGEVCGTLTCIDPHRFNLTIASKDAALAGTWLQGMSTAFIHYDPDLCQRVPGPVGITSAKPVEKMAKGEAIFEDKPYYVGMTEVKGKQAKPEFVWEEPEDAELKRTPLYETHVKSGAKMIPFAGWEMPVWYTSVLEEHNATRKAAGLFDVTHMGVFQAEGPDAGLFLDSVTGNDIVDLDVGQSCYTQFMDPQANVIDDLLIYRRETDKWLVVVNAANEDKDWAWLEAVRQGKVLIDTERPWAVIPGRHVILRNLRDEKEGKDRLVDVALQGPKSTEILFKLAESAEAQKIKGLKRGELCESHLAGVDVVVSRTGYTGEKICYELFVHPDNTVRFWDALVEAGTPLGLLPCGLGARDSLRTEAGLPLYGHEMGGETNLTVGEAGFLSSVKLNSSWFIGRSAFQERERTRTSVVARFCFNEKGVRMARHGDPIVDAKGRMIGKVTSCAIDKDGYLTGHAFVDIKSAVEGTPILIYQGAPSKPQKTPSELTLGDKVALPGAATIVSRFYKG